MTTAIHPSDRQQTGLNVWVGVVVALLVGLWTGPITRADGPGSEERPIRRLFSPSTIFRAQSPELFALPPVDGVASAPNTILSPLPAGTTESLGLPLIPEPAVKSSPGPATSPNNSVGRPGCKTCGGVGQFPMPDGSGFRSCSSCGGSGCIPGRLACPPYEGHSFLGRFCGELYQSLCCPDPCYEPSWVPTANAAFFQDYARPRTIMRFRNDYGWDLRFPDRNEFFWARQQIQTRNPAGAIVNKVGGTGPGRPRNFPANRVYRGISSVDYDQFSFYSETAASPRASLFLEVPYRISDPIDGYNYHSGFSDINFGTKGVIFDTELLLLTIQFRTYTPVGLAKYGLGTGHVSLEPSLLAALKLGPDTYLQGQLAEWIPIGGDLNYQGSVIHYHGSLNQVLFRLAANSPVIGTIETNAWTFQDGLYTDPNIGRNGVSYRRSSMDTYVNIGPGLRASICNAIDFGGAVAFPISEPNWGSPILRLEFRILY